MRVMVIANSYPLIRGEEVVTSTFFLRHFCRELVRQGAQVCVVTPSRTGFAPIADKGIETVTFDWAGQDSASLSSLKIFSIKGVLQILNLFSRGKSTAAQTARRFGPDVVLAAFALPSGQFARQAVAGSKIPYFVWCLGSDIHTWAKRPGLKQLTQKVLFQSAGNFADGFDLAEQVTAISGRPTEFLASSIPMPAIQRKARENGMVRFLYAGRFEPVKGTDVLLEAWSILVDKGYGERARLTLCGGGQSFTSQIERLRTHPKIGPTLDIAGWVKPSDLPARYGIADALVIPSRKESIPIVFTEAVEAGCALVTTRAGDMGTLIDRFQLGQAVPVEDPKSLAQALIGFIERGHIGDPQKRSEFLQMMDLSESARIFLKRAAESLEFARDGKAL